MSTATTLIPGALQIAESTADVPTGDGVFYRVSGGQIQVSNKSAGGVWLPLVLRDAVKTPFLTDADATIDTEADKCSLYILPPNTLTATRTITFAAAAQVNRHVVTILRFDLSANDLVIRDSAPTTLFSGTGSPAKPLKLVIFYNTSAWIPNTRNYFQTI